MYRYSRFVITILLTAWLAVGGHVADAQKSSSAKLRSETEQFIRQLDANTRKERLKAEQRLLERGPEILPHLPPPELLPNVSVREAVRRIRIALERIKARESVLPTRVTIPQKQSLIDLLQEISDQTGNQFDLSHIPEKIRQRIIKTGYHEREFWPVLDDVMKQTSLRYQSNAATGTIAFKTSNDAAQSKPVAVSYAGPFRIAVQSAALRPLLGDEKFRLLRVYLGMTSEPRLRPLFLKYSGSDITAVANAKRKLVAFNPDARYELPLGEGGNRLKIQLDFKVPIEASIKTVSLAGKVTMQTAAGSEKIVFKKLADGRNIARRRGGVTVTLQDARFRKADEGTRTARVRVAVAYDVGGPAFESHRTWIFHNTSYLESSDGTRIERNSQFSTRLQTDGAVAVEYNFDHLKSDPATYRFVYVAPTLIINVPVEIKFSGINVLHTNLERKQP